MANTLDLQQPSSMSMGPPVHPSPISLYRENSESAIDELANTKDCGIFMLMEKLLVCGEVKRQTVLTMLDILRRINHGSITVHPSVDDQPSSFVRRMLSIADRVSNERNPSESTLCASALRLTTSLKCQQPNDQLRAVWLDFLVLYFREKLYSLYRT